MTQWSRNAEELGAELEKITETLSNYAYGLRDKTIASAEIETLLFSTCNHLDRLAEDIKSLDDNRQHQRLTETTTTTKTIYL